MERLQVLGIFTSLSGQLGVEAVLFLLHQLLIALIDRKKLFVSRQWNILFHQDILNSPDIHTTQAGALRKRHRRGYAGGLASTNALGDQIQPVDGHIIRRNMSAGAQQAFHLLRNNGPVGDLDRVRNH